MQSLLFRSLGLDCWNRLLQRGSYYSLCGLFALVCGGSLPSISGGNFTSPGYNGIRDYASNLDCEWTLSNPNRENSSLTIHFVRLSLESHQDCALDVLEFRVGEFKECIFSPICMFFLFLQTTTTATISAHELQKSLVGAKLKSCVPRWEMGPKNCEGSGTLARRVSVSGLLCGRLTHMVLTRLCPVRVLHWGWEPLSLLRRTQSTPDEPYFSWEF